MRLGNAVIAFGLVLFLSLTANVFMAGVMMGKTYSAASGARAAWVKTNNALSRQLSDADFAALKNTLLANREKIEALRRDHDNSRDLLGEAMKTNDHAALDAAMKVEMKKKQAILALMQDVRAEAAKKLSPEGQVIFHQMITSKPIIPHHDFVADFIPDVGNR